jgi:hypothetical protein
LFENDRVTSIGRYTAFLFLPNNTYITNIYIAGAEALSNALLAPAKQSITNASGGRKLRKTRQRRKGKKDKPKSRQTEGAAGVPESPYSTLLGATRTREGQTASKWHYSSQKV